MNYLITFFRNRHKFRVDPAKGVRHFGESGRDQEGDEGRGREGDGGLRRNQGVEQGAQG